MRKFYAFLLFAFSAFITSAQDSTCTSHNNSNGAGSITFNIKNNSTNPIMVTDIKTAMYTGSGGAYTFTLLYNTSAINQPTTPWSAGTVGAGQNGWQLAGTSSVTIPTHTVPVTVMSGLTLVIPAGATYGFALSTSGTIGYQTLTAGAGVNNFTSNGVSLQTGDGIGWGGGTFPTTPANYPRGWDGCVKWVQLPPCSGTPVAGTVVSSVSNPCPTANFTLSLNGSTIASGIGYQWQSSPNNTTWSNIPSANGATLTTSQLVSTYYRAILSCGTNSDTTAALQVTSPGNLAAGTYTINPVLPASGTNFQTFAAAVAAMNCGIAGPIVFNVAPGTYNEQVTIPAILNSSAINTVTFNGHGATLVSSPSSSTARTGLTLNGSDHVAIDSLNIDVSAGTYGWGVLLTNQADSNKITNCTITTSISSTSSNYAGLLINGSTSTTSSSGNNGNGNLISGNIINGGYYGISNYGSTAPYNQDNSIINNKVRDFYFYGIYNYGNNDLVVRNNDVSRPTRTVGITTTYGIYVSGSTKVVVEKNRVHDVYAAVTGTNTNTVYSLYLASSGTASDFNYATNNAVYNINKTTGSVYGVYSPLYNYWKIYHNTIVLDDAAATAGSTYGIYHYGTASEVKNNIVYITRGGTGTKYLLYYPTTTATQIPLSNNNILYMNAPAGTNNIGRLGSTDYPTFAGWQAANGGTMDLQSLTVNPQFANPLIGNLYPNNTVIANIGASLGVSTDIIEFTRNPTSPTPGAYEIVPSAGADFGLIGMVTPVQKQCYSSAENVTVTIRNYSANLHNFVTNPVTVNVSVTGPNATTFSPVIVNTGTLASNGTLNVVISNNYNMSAGGTYVFSGATSTFGDANVNNNAMQNATIIDTSLAAGTVFSNPSSYCVNGGIPNLTLIGGGGGSIQWQESPTGLAGTWTNVGANNAAYTPSAAITTVKYFRAYRTCSGNGDTSAVIPVSVNNPQLLSTTPAARCNPGTLTLSATVNAGATVNWYNAPTGGTLVGTGPNFTTPSLTNTTTYYAAAAQGGVGANTGVKTGDFAICGFPVSSTLTDYPLRFTTTKAVTVNSAWIVPSATSVTVALRAQGSTTNIFTQTFTFQPSQVGNINNPVLINLGWSIPTAGNYQLTNTSGGLWRITALGCGYPFTSPGGGFTITGSASSSMGTASTTYYNGFYQVNVTEGCETTRVPVVAEVSYNTAITTNPTGNITTCVGSSFTLAVAATGANLNYQWRKNGVNIPNSNNDTLIFNPVALGDAGTYDVVITGLCGSAVTSGVSIVNVSASNTWLGKVNTDWHNVNNWCGGIPTSANDVTIFPGTPYQPVVDAQAEVKTLTLAPGAIMMVAAGDTLNIYGNFVNNGTFSAANSTIIFKGTTVQNVDEITASNININSAGVNLNGNMTANQTVTMNAGKLTLGINNLSAGSIQNGNANSYIVTNSTGSTIIKNAGATAMPVPIGPNSSSYNPVTIANGGGRDYAVRVSTGLMPTIANPGLAVNRTWTISPNIAPASAATVTLQYADAHMNTPGVGSNNMEVGVHNGTSWTVVTPNVTPTGSATARQVISTTSQFGPITVANKGGISWITAVPSVDATISSIQLLPSIVETKTLLRLISTRAAKLRLDVIDGNGRVVLTFNRQVMTGQNDIMLEMSKLAAGSYSISGSTDKGKIQVIRFVKL